MGLLRNAGASQPEIDDNVEFHLIQGGFPFKRNPSHHHHPPHHRHHASFDRQLPRSATSRSHLHNRLTLKGLLLWLFPFYKSKSGFYVLIFVVVFLFALASMVMQSSITSVFCQRAECGRYHRHDLRFSSSLRFVPGPSSLATDSITFTPSPGSPSAPLG